VDRETVIDRRIGLRSMTVTEIASRQLLRCAEDQVQPNPGFPDAGSLPVQLVITRCLHALVGQPSCSTFRRTIPSPASAVLSAAGWTTGDEARREGRAGQHRATASTPAGPSPSDPSVLPSPSVRLRSRPGLQLLGDRREVVADRSGREEHRTGDLADGPALLCDRQDLGFPRGQR
jgi:hypothetical protein